MASGLRGAISRLISALQAPQETVSRNTRYNLMVQLRSPHRTLADEALRQAQAKGWLSDGTLVEAELSGMSFNRGDFSHADLQRAILSDAQLSGANFFCANLNGADLRGVNLTSAGLQNVDMQGVILHYAFLMESDLRGADLRHAELNGARLGSTNLYGARLFDWQFIPTETMCGAIMPDGARYDGRYCLPGDLELAAFLGLPLNQPAAMAEFYAVTLDDFLNGQQWAAQYLEQITQDLDRHGVV